MKIILYTNDCPKCTILKRALDSSKLPYERVTDMETFLEKGFKSMPHLEIDGNIYNFGEAMFKIKEMQGGANV